MRYFVKNSINVLEKSKLHIEAIAELKGLDHLVLEDDVELLEFKNYLCEKIRFWNSKYPKCCPMRICTGNLSSEIIYITDGNIFNMTIYKERRKLYAVSKFKMESEIE